MSATDLDETWQPCRLNATGLIIDGPEATHTGWVRRVQLVCDEETCAASCELTVIMDDNAGKRPNELRKFAAIGRAARLAGWNYHQIQTLSENDEMDMREILCCPTCSVKRADRFWAQLDAIDTFAEKLSGGGFFG